ncbi:hypothetical protein AYO21_07429 [Fonsecaea monophora]|uniref:FAD-binding FR-type domain-containing protein n=1 Tax=Fonsecaea monophora TaxID=254056 RepID=A0A177F4X0_9EURO|nr:hypothetical protein AYO21_07429 [Fonsecaea monophora]KAH0846335.1 metalloreductase Fre8 [Fonsecaea pedrosoi]OAG38309.1 hypothetical protein AYO21_07429 [Fonsecaea monophora]
MAYLMSVKLSATELEERRRQLNGVGFRAWLSPIVLLVVVYLYRRYFHPLLFPSTSALSSSGSRQASRVQLYLRRAVWTLQTTYIPEFGPLSVQLLGLIYAAWLLYLTFHNTGNDYMHLTKAFGHVAVSQLPMHYLLSLKHTTYSPIMLTTGLTHERLNAIHRMFGRIVHVFLAAHAVLYLRFFVAMGFLPKRIKDPDVRLGVLAFWMFNFLGLLSVPVVRRNMYHVLFYRSHVVLSALVIPVLWAHVPYTRFYVAQVAAIWILSGWLRRVNGATNVREVRCEDIAGTQLVRVTLLVDKASALARAVPGQHVYVRQRRGMIGPKTPFTIANVQSSARGEKEAQLVEVIVVFRNMGGPGTSFLASLSKREAATNEVQIEGPYGEASVYMPEILDSGLDNDSVLLVAGGIGATYILPIYTALLQSRRRRRRRADGTRGGEAEERIKMVWLVKSLADAQWGIELLVRCLAEEISLDVDVYITTVSSSSLSPEGLDLSSASSLASLKKRGLKIHQLGHRPALDPVVDDIFSSSNIDRDPPTRVHGVTVFVCGPRRLSGDLRALLGRRVVSEERRVRWFEEVFGFGGS